jgi:tRNA U55 pseudouridine synthase TruB
MDCQAKSVISDRPDHRHRTAAVSKRSSHRNARAKRRPADRARQDHAVNRDHRVTMALQAAMDSLAVPDLRVRLAHQDETVIRALVDNPALRVRRFQATVDLRVNQADRAHPADQALADHPDHLAATVNRAVLVKWAHRVNREHPDSRAEVVHRVNRAEVAARDLAITAHRLVWLQDTKEAAEQSDIDLLHRRSIQNIQSDIISCTTLLIAVEISSG